MYPQKRRIVGYTFDDRMIKDVLICYQDGDFDRLIRDFVHNYKISVWAEEIYIIQNIRNEIGESFADKEAAVSFAVDYMLERAEKKEVVCDLILWKNDNVVTTFRLDGNTVRTTEIP